MVRKKAKKRTGKKVSGHIRHMASGKPVRVSQYKRKKPTFKKPSKIIPFKENFVVTQYRDKSSGRLVSKRKYKKVKKNYMKKKRRLKL